MTQEHGSLLASERARVGAGLVDFGVNINPYGAPPSVLEAARAASLLHYPDQRAEGLCARFAERIDVPADRLVFGNGGAELIWAACRAFLSPSRALVVMGPTFSEPAAAAAAVGAPVVEVASRLDAGPAERALDLREVLCSGPAPVGLVYVCTPNNPTGHLVDEEELASIEGLLPDAALLVDRSFESVAAAQTECGRVERGPTEEGTPSGVLRVRGGPVPGRIEVRSLTKDFAVPGLRLGFALGEPDVLRRCRAQIPPWSVSAPATAGALAAVEPAALEHLQRTRRLWLADTAALFDGLAQRGFEAVRRSTPFGLVRVEDADAARRALLTRGVHVRSCASFGLPEHLRLSGRAAPDRAALFAALESSGVRPAPVRVEDASRVETTAPVEDVDEPRS